MRLAGIMFWAPDLDDFGGKACQEGKYPLMTTAVNLFRGRSASQPPNQPVTVPTQTIATVMPTTAPTLPTRPPVTPSIPSTSTTKRVVCYYTK